jgi:hypothetical protein
MEEFMSIEGLGLILSCLMSHACPCARHSASHCQVHSRAYVFFLHIVVQTHSRMTRDSMSISYTVETVSGKYLCELRTCRTCATACTICMLCLKLEVESDSDSVRSAQVDLHFAPHCLSTLHCMNAPSIHHCIASLSLSLCHNNAHPLRCSDT